MLGDLTLRLQRGTRGRKGQDTLYRPINGGEELPKELESAKTNPVPPPQSSHGMDHSPKSSQMAKRSHVM